MEKILRAFVVAGVSLVTVWWLLSDSGERERGFAPTANPEDVVDARIEAARPADVPQRASGGDVILADFRLAAPIGEPTAAIVAADAVEPIPLIEGITLPGGMWTLHAKMEREPRDAAWADDMERQFSSYFASKPELGRNFSLPSVLCRTHFCEIQAIGYGHHAFDTWRIATEDLRDQPWGQQLRAGGIYTTERAPNEQAVVLILMRPFLIERDGLVDLGGTSAPR